MSEAEEQPGQYIIKEDCKKSIMRVAELSSDDFHLDRHLYFACREDREHFCENVRRNPLIHAHCALLCTDVCSVCSFQTPAGEGKVYKCLFNHKFEESMSEKVRLVFDWQKQLLRMVYRK